MNFDHQWDGVDGVMVNMFFTFLFFGLILDNLYIGLMYLTAIDA